MTNVPRRNRRGGDRERGTEGTVERGKKLGVEGFLRAQKHPPLEETGGLSPRAFGEPVATEFMVTWDSSRRQPIQAYLVLSTLLC